MDRRSFIFGAAGLAMSPGCCLAKAVSASYLLARRAYVACPEFVRQECPQWCWAASASMIFASLGHPIDQKRIVAGANHVLACMAQQSGIITSVLNAGWIDDNGAPFWPHVDASYDQVNREITITVDFIIEALLQNRPLLYANAHHCMVLAAIDYLETPAGTSIINANVLDPWPGAAPIHPLTPAELRPAFVGGQMTYLAAVGLWNP